MMLIIAIIVGYLVLLFLLAWLCVLFLPRSSPMGILSFLNRRNDDEAAAESVEEAWKSGRSKRWHDRHKFRDAGVMLAMQNKFNFNEDQMQVLRTLLDILGPLLLKLLLQFLLKASKEQPQPPKAA